MTLQAKGITCECGVQEHAVSSLRTAFKALRETPAPQINIFLNRTGLFGEQIHQQIDQLPRYSVEMKCVTPFPGTL